MSQFQKTAGTELVTDEPTPADLASHLAQLDARVRYERILAAERGISLVRALSSETLLYTMKEVGLNDALDLLGMASPQQVRAMLDLDCWRRDRLDDERLLNWLLLLDESGGSKLAEWFLQTDVELLVLLIRRHLEVVRKADVEDDPNFDQSPYFTFDDQYLLRFRGEPEPILHALLERIRVLDYPAYQRALENSLFELESGLEEAAYRWRTARLADRGYPAHDEARTLFRFLPPDTVSFAAYQRRGIAVDVAAEDDPLPPPDHALALLDAPRSFFAQTLAALPGETAAEVGHELAYLTNAVVTVEARDTGEVEEIRRCARTAHDYVNIGLAFASREDGPAARNLLQTTRIHAFFRTGWSLVQRLHHVAGRLAEDLSSAVGADWERYLDPPFREACTGLRSRLPLYYVGLDAPGEILSRRFATFAEVQRAATLLTDIPTWFHVLRRNGIFPEQEPPEGVTLGVLWNTGFAHWVLESEASIRPLRRSDLQALHDRLADATPDERWAAFLDHAVRQAGLDAEQRPALDRFAAFARDKLEETLAVDAETADLRFLDGILVEIR